MINYGALQRLRAAVTQLQKEKNLIAPAVRAALSRQRHRRHIAGAASSKAEQSRAKQLELTHANHRAMIDTMMQSCNIVAYIVWGKELGHNGNRKRKENIRAEQCTIQRQQTRAGYQQERRTTSTKNYFLDQQIAVVETIRKLQEQKKCEVWGLKILVYEALSYLCMRP